MGQLIFGLDTETTGLNVDRGDRIIEFYGEVWTWPERKKILTLDQRISNQGKTIAKKAQEVHGISAADLIGMPRWNEFGHKLKPIFDRKPLTVAHNVGFDMGFIAHHQAEACLSLSPDLMLFDTAAEGMTASYDGKPPSLREFCWAMGVEYNPDEAHAGKYDVQVMIEALFSGIDLGYLELPFDEQKAAA